MGDHQIHRSVSEDGTQIAGRVEGQGPPLVLVHGGLGDGEVSWRFLLPYLVDQFTCYMMSTRGRGLSGEHPDHSRERHFEDIALFIESVGEPVGVFGHSSGGLLAIGGATLAPAFVRCIALYEPYIPEAVARMSDDAYARVSGAVAHGKMGDALRLTMSEIIRLGDDDQSFFSTPPASEIAEGYISMAVRELPELNRSLDGVAIEKLTMPMLFVQGALSGTHFKNAVSHLADQIDHARVVEVAGAGHLGPLTAAESVARELVRFFKD